MATNDLKKLIYLVIKEEFENVSKVDEPEDGPLGKVLFGPNRKDDVENEPDTEKEEKYFDSIYTHMRDNYSKDLKKYFDEIYGLSQSGKYEKLLKPAHGHAYRILFGLNEEALEEHFNVSTKEIPYGKVKIFKKNVILNPTSKEIQSWSMNLNLETILSLHGITTEGTLKTNKPYAVIVRTRVPDGGKFILNPNFARKILNLEEYEEEEEIVSKGPVKVNKFAIANLAWDKENKIFDEKDLERISTIVNKIKEITKNSSQQSTHPKTNAHNLEAALRKLIRNIFYEKFSVIIGSRILDKVFNTIAHTWSVENLKDMKVSDFENYEHNIIPKKNWVQELIAAIKS